MTECPNCGATLRQEVENVYEIDGTRYFDVRLMCDKCSYSKPSIIKRKSPIPKAADSATEMTASLKLREYLPERKEEETSKPTFDLEILKALNPFKNMREIITYGVAILLGLAVEIAGLYFERYMREIQLHPMAGFWISLLIFIFAPIIIVGTVMYYSTKDPMKSILLGAVSIPLTIIILANLPLAMGVMI
jgi:hypothetical protein